MTDFDHIDYFSDPSVVEDPYPYFEYLRQTCPAFQEPHHGVVAVTGYDDVAAVLRDTETFSTANAAAGPFPPLPFAPEGDDISPLIESHREQFLWHQYLPNFDPPKHTEHRAVLAGLFTPKRLKENEEFMWRWADRLLDEFIAEGHCDFVQTYAKPFPLLVIADLLGVPEADHSMFRRLIAAGLLAGPQEHDGAVAKDPPTYLDQWFSTYIEERRRQPRNDMLTELATARFPDGSTPTVMDIVNLATFLFLAGHETTAHLLANSLQVLAEQPALQATLREHRERIPNFVEEMLRTESPVKSDFRLTRVATTIGGVEVAPGTTVMLLPGAANRDPSRFECPAKFRPDRSNVRQHLAFGRGVHSCPGAPLARIEARVSIERILDRMADIRVSETHHGPAGNRHFDYFPGYMMRGLDALHLEYTPRKQL